MNHLYYGDNLDILTRYIAEAFSVKGGGVGVKDVRDLDSVVTKTGAASGVLISIEERTKPMREWAANTGSYTSLFNGQKYPRLQLRTIGQLMAGVAIERPSGNVAVDETFKKAPKAAGPASAHPELGLEPGKKSGARPTAP